MPESLPLILSPVFQPVWVMFLAMAIERLWHWPDTYHPLSFARLLATNMARKVNKSSENSRIQQLISGSLAIIVLLLPLVLILVIFTTMAEFPLFFDGFLLLIALQFSPLLSRHKKIADAIKGDKKALARNMLNPIVLRETDKLSPMGIAKASIESLLLRFGYQYCSVLFWYLVAGGTGALAYRLIYEFSQVWNTKLARFRYFGKPAAGLVLLFSWLPVRISAWCFAIGQNLGGAFKGLRRLSGKVSQHQVLLALNGGALSIELGGPAYYEGKKVRLMKVGGQREIRFDDMARTRLGINKAILVLVVLVIFSSAMVFAIQSGKSL